MLKKSHVVLFFQITTWLLIFSQNGYAQYESEEISVALDNTNYRCTSRDLVATTETFTKGGSSVGYATNRRSGSTSEITCQVDGPSRVTFDWRLDQVRPIDRIEFQYLESNNLETTMLTLDSTVDWITQTFVIPEEATFIKWVFWDQGGDAWVDNLRISEVSPYSAALDNDDVDVLSSGDQVFSTTTSTKTKGDKSVLSGRIDHGERSFLFTTVDGGQSVTFDWKISSQLGYDGLIFYFLTQDGELVGEPVSISGESDWLTVKKDIPGSDPIVMVWLYVKDDSISSGQDAGWIDNLRFGRSTSNINIMPGILDLLLNK